MGDKARMYDQLDEASLEGRRKGSADPLQLLDPSEYGMDPAAALRVRLMRAAQAAAIEQARQQYAETVQQAQGNGGPLEERLRRAAEMRAAR